MAGGRARSPSGLLLRLSLLLVLLACFSPASSSSLPGLEPVSPRAEDGAQVALHLVKRQATGLASSEEAALLALLDLVPRADRRSAASMLDRLFTTLDLNGETRRADRLAGVRDRPQAGRHHEPPPLLRLSLLQRLRQLPQRYSSTSVPIHADL
ncbi:uncharacterized protein [Penaeus vannamei]|uniref:uncharacterized protein n=1 Tax=Penaeus vannamei TaxID=6689 RepID=UPI00387F5D8D